MIHDFVLFVTTGILLNLTPGPDTVYILGRSIAHGRRAGVASALGISVGSVFHTCAAALGLSRVSGWAGGPVIAALAGAGVASALLSLLQPNGLALWRRFFRRRGTSFKETDPPRRWI